MTGEDEHPMGRGSGDAVEEGVVLREEVTRRLDAVRADARWGELSEVGLSGAVGARSVVASFTARGASGPLASHVLVHWQRLSSRSASVVEALPPADAPALPALLRTLEEQRARARCRRG